MKTTWFTRLTGLAETSPEAVRAGLAFTGDALLSRANGRLLAPGRFETPSLAELRARAAATLDGSVPSAGPFRPRLSETIGDAARLHADPAHAEALFQVASQFNCLEMTSPGVTPEDGIGIYEDDPTQGPACAIACGAGTIYRNYFVPLGNALGQTATRQLDCLADLGRALGNTDGRLWQMRNGYALANAAGLASIATRLAGAGEAERDHLRGCLRIGLQWQTQVTVDGAHHRVSQAYASALPVAYGQPPAEAWEPFARLVLEATYEATFLAAALNRAATGQPTLFLTLVGGGAFGNALPWITDAIARACQVSTAYPLDIRLVSYRRPNPGLAELLYRFSGEAA